MPTLTELKPRIDSGEIAELRIIRQIRIGRDIFDGTAVTIAHNTFGYVWTLYRLLGEERIYIRDEQHNHEWEHLLRRIEGIQTTSQDWTIQSAQEHCHNEQ